METLMNFAIGAGLSQVEQYEFISKSLNEVKDDVQYKKAIRCKGNEIMDSIGAYAKVSQKYPGNILPLLGIFEELINLNDFEYAIRFYNKYAPTIDNKYLILFENAKDRLNQTKSVRPQNPQLKYFGQYKGTIQSDKGTDAADLIICGISKNSDKVIFIINIDRYVTASLSNNGQITIDDTCEEEFVGEDTINGSGLINNQLEIQFNLEYSYALSPNIQRFKVIGRKERDYFHTIQDKFIL